MTEQNVLVGKTLTGIKIAEDKEAILFQATEGDLVVRVYADCCSHTWVENIELPALGFPAVVTAVHGLDLPKDYYSRHPGPAEQECLALYGCTIATDRGEIVIDYRNESNGYYGGNLAWPDDSFSGGVFGQNVSKQKWEDVR